jgi:hypothetical protein
LGKDSRSNGAAPQQPATKPLTAELHPAMAQSGLGFRAVLPQVLLSYTCARCSVQPVVDLRGNAGVATVPAPRAGHHWTAK